MTRLVRHDPHAALIDAVAAEIHVELHFLLQHHHQLAGLVVSAKKFVRVVQPINVFPAAAGKGFEKCGPADVIENSFPIERITQIAK